MFKYVDAKVVFSEIPDEITLAISISGCPFQCKGCHSSYLSENIGDSLTDIKLRELIDKNSGITCVAFMGGDSSPGEIDRLSNIVKSIGLKSAWYSGRDKMSSEINILNFDYIKIGPYIESFGPLNNRNTNQKFYMVDKSGCLINYTYKFQNIC
jgi:anaerobic ribonucleoside-triphosphate reductase activating protein